MLHSSSLVFIGADAVSTKIVKKKLVETFFKASTILLPFWLLKVDVVGKKGASEKGPVFLAATFSGFMLDKASTETS